MANLTAAEMVEVAEVFQGSYSHVLANMTQEAAQSITAIVTEFILREQPWVLVTPEGLTRAIDLVWARNGVRDFIMSLSFTFFSRWGQTEDQVEGLIHNIARGCAMVAEAGVNKSLDAVPAPLAQRLTSVDAARKLLLANRWLVIALMLPLFIQVALPSGTGTKTR